MKHKWETIGLIAIFMMVFGYSSFQKYEENRVVESCVTAGSSWTDVNPGFGTTMGCVAK